MMRRFRSAMARRCGLQATALANAPVVLLGFATPVERLIAAGVSQLAGRLAVGGTMWPLRVGAD